MAASKKACTRLPTPPVVWVHQIHTPGGASGSATMVMVFARLFVLFCAVLQLMTSQSGSLYVKNVWQHILKMRLMVLLFVPHWRAPYKK
jgi:hypothetical protein